MLQIHTRHFLTALLLFILPVSLSFAENTISDSADITWDEAEAENTDPFETFNRKMHAFNKGFDRILLRPVSEGYNKVLPGPVNKGVTNFFANLADVNTSLNNLLQGKPLKALSDAGRFIVNSTLGVGGLFDIATRMKLEKHNEDFGQTFAVWGMESGPYVVLPIIGSSTVRDAFGLGLDIAVNPVTHLEDDTASYALTALFIIDTNADLYEVADLAERAALDPYIFNRESYLQLRENAINDGADDEFGDF